MRVLLIFLADFQQENKNSIFPRMSNYSLRHRGRKLTELQRQSVRLLAVQHAWATRTYTRLTQLTNQILCLMHFTPDHYWQRVARVVKSFFFFFTFLPFDLKRKRPEASGGRGANNTHNTAEVCGDLWIKTSAWDVSAGFFFHKHTKRMNVGPLMYHLLRWHDAAASYQKRTTRI